MESLERLRGRLTACDELRGLVHTMRTLAAVSVHQHDQAVRALAVYRRTVELALQVALRRLGERPKPPRVTADAPLGVVIFGSDHGMCGRFNEAICEFAASLLAPPRADGAPLRVLAVGARLAMHLAPLGLAPEATHPVPASTARITVAVRRLLLAIDRWHADGVERVWLVHQRPLGSASHQPAAQTLLPLDLGVFAEIEGRRWEARGLPTCSMAPGQLLAALLRQYLFVSVFRACAESIASENGARLVAMQGAEKGLDERGRALEGALRRRRQESITAELLEVLGGYEAQRAAAGTDARG